MFIRSSVRAHRIFILCALKSLPRNPSRQLNFWRTEPELPLTIRKIQLHGHWSYDHLLNANPRSVPEFIDPVFTKTSPKRSFSLNRKRAFWLVFAKTGSIISGTAVFFRNGQSWNQDLYTCKKPLGPDFYFGKLKCEILNYLFIQYLIQHCFIYRPSESTVSEDAGIEKLVCQESLLYPKTESIQGIMFCRLFYFYIESRESFYCVRICI